ncbi:MAG: cytochrome c-type biogenesis protein [Pseudomonadota bacterium]
MKPIWPLLLCFFIALPAVAVEPDEILEDPAMEERARNISSGLRCLVCRNESIDESSADLARDLRLLVRERLLAGDSDAEVVAYIVDRYGEFVLLRPPPRGSTLILYLAGPVLALTGAALAIAFVRRRAAKPEAEISLDADEADRLKQILDRDTRDKM